MSPYWFAVHSELRIRAQALMCAAWLAGSTAVLAQSVVPDQVNGTPSLIQRQGQQKQRLMQGQAATQVSQRQANALVQAPQPVVAPVVSPASSPKPVTPADVLLAKEARIRRLNAAKVESVARP